MTETLTQYLKIQSLPGHSVRSHTKAKYVCLNVHVYSVSWEFKAATQKQCDMWQPKGVHLNLYDCSSGALYGMLSSNS